MAIIFWFTLFIVAFPCLLIYIGNWLTRHFTSLYDLKLVGKPRNDADKGNTAVVLGGGLAGILSARVLFDHYKHVIIIEHDDYDSQDRVRPSVPQGAHAHLVLAIANLCLRTLFPSIEDELRRRGARISDLGKAMKWFYWGSWRVRCQMALPFWCCSRPFLDTLIRDMFIHYYGEKVTFLTKRQILDPVLSTDLEKLGITSYNLPTALSNNIPITGDYSKIIDPSRPSDEFRVVGVRIKKRGIKAVQNIISAVEQPSECAINSVLSDTDQLDEEKQKDLSQYTTMLKIDTASLMSSDKHRPVKKIEDNPALNTQITQRAIDHDEEYVLGDLLVDCTGGTSIFHKWCDRLWNLPVPTSQLKASSMYVSHLFHEPADFENNPENDFVCLPIYPTPGLSNYFGYLMRIENNLWQITAMGTAGNPVPNTNLLEFIHHLRKLDHPLLHKLVANAQPVAGESLYTYHPKVYQCRHWSDMPVRPDGLIAVGNSNTIFDPMYGQGMSGACLAALALNTTLCQQQYKTSQSLQSYKVSQSYFHILKDRLAFPWTLCIVEDSRWEGIELNDYALGIKNSFPGQFLKYWIRQGMVLASTSPLAQATAMGIMNMTCSFATLLYPKLVFEVLSNVFIELIGKDYSPEQRYLDEVKPGQMEREKWEIAPVLSQEKIDAGLVYDYVIPA